MFAHLIEWCREHSFKHIRLSAEGGWIVNAPYRWKLLPQRGIRQLLEQNGYYTWGRFGFDMQSEDEKKYQSWNRYFRCEGEHFPHLLSTDTHRKKWKELGFAWQGKFDLAPDSINLSHWERYRQSRAVT